MAILSEMVVPTVDVAIEDIQVDDTGIPLTDDPEKLRYLIWKNCHLLIDKGNGLPLVARGAVRDIVVGNFKPIVQSTTCGT